MITTKLKSFRRLYYSSLGRLSRNIRARVGLQRMCSVFLITPVVSNYQVSRCRRILQFIARHKLPVVSEGLRLEGLDAFKSADDVVFVAFLDPQDSASFGAFSNVASRYRDEFRFGTVTDQTVAESQDVKVPAVVCYRSVDGDKLVTNFESDKLDGWVKESSRPVLGDLTVLNRQRLLDVSNPLIV